MNSRLVSDDPQETVVYAREFLAGLGAAGVLGSGKHFPGLGRRQARQPSRSAGDREVLEKVVGGGPGSLSHAAARLPVRDGVACGVSGSHGRPTPASLSKKWITDILRKKIGYRGLIVSDDLEMGGVLAAAPIEQAAVEHIRAGGDLCLICHKEEFVTRAYEELVRTAEPIGLRPAGSGVVRRVFAFKKKNKSLARWAKTLPSKVCKTFPPALGIRGTGSAGGTVSSGFLPASSLHRPGIEVAGDRCRGHERDVGGWDRCRARSALQI